ncbi:MAG: restriction endonuclease subunit S [Chromatiaceae bacterium]|nr:restriction endonuclease subunit S [Chromatiaceae bacterium]
MSNEALANYLDIDRRGIDPALHRNESFYYYSLPDFDEGKMLRVALGTEIGSNKFVVPSGSVLISKLNPRIKRVWLVQNDGVFRSISSTEFVVVTPKRRANTLYLYYVLQSDEVYSRLEAEAIGTTNSHVRFKPEGLLRIRAWFPSVHAQAKIAEILRTIDQAIEETEALIEKYQQIKAGLMHDLFTRGIGPDGKLRPPREQAPELYQETPIGWIPKEWEARPLSDCFSSPPKNGYSPKEVDEWEGLYVLGLGCLTKRGFRPLQLKNAPRGATASGAALQDGDFLISRSNTPNAVGLCGVYRDIGHPSIYPDLMIRLRTKDNLDRQFLERYLLSEAVRLRISAIAVGTSGSMVKINAKTLSSLRIALPSVDEQPLLVEQARPIENQLAVLEQQVDKLRTQKAGLMHDLLTGKVPVNPDPPEPADA